MDIQLNPTLEEIRRAFTQIATIALGRAVRSVVVGTSETPIPHYLKRVPEAWILISPQYGADLPGESTPPDETNLYLTAASEVTVDLWVW